ncbi:MAG: holo-ACP synthase [Ignavibacteriales bacterium]|nr:holo-ACP synthase [Ignavibacteriales bacterium]
MSTIQGIGVDVVDVDRMKQALDAWGQQLMEKLFTKAEITYCTAKKNPSEHFAARFAAKEAVSKAIQTGWSGAFRWKDVEVANSPSGAPKIIVHHTLASTLGAAKIHLSLSHTKTTVVAFAIIEKA